MRSTYRIVHEGLNTTNHGCVNWTLSSLIVHVAEKVQDDLQTVQFNKPNNKTEMKKEKKLQQTIPLEYKNVNLVYLKN